MKLTLQEQKHLDSLLYEYKNNEKVLEMKKYIQHGSISTYNHVESVAYFSYWMNKRLHLGANEKTLVAGAFLHDFYLYDWHTDSEGMHGFFHPGIACKNAVKYFDVDTSVQMVIKCHMWPLTITNIPFSRESWIVCVADKFVSTKETLFRRKKVG